jgi:hypothetical protein
MKTSKTYANFISRSMQVQVCPIPVQTFEVGEKVSVGNLKNVIIMERYDDGKAYLIEYIRVVNSDNPTEIRESKYSWWFDIDKLRFCDDTAKPLFSADPPGQLYTKYIDSLMHMMSFHGIVCDPRYQRGYVWSITNQTDLIDSIFNRINIGMFVFSRHACDNKSKSTSDIYINLDGDEISIDPSKNDTTAIIDGQQRLTTIWRFIHNQFKYNGLYWKDLALTDQWKFKNSLISVRIFDDCTVSHKDILKLFIQINKGVSQDSSHLAQIIKDFEELE